MSEKGERVGWCVHPTYHGMSLNCIFYSNLTLYLQPHHLSTDNTGNYPPPRTTHPCCLARMQGGRSRKFILYTRM